MAARGFRGARPRFGYGCSTPGEGSFVVGGAAVPPREACRSCAGTPSPLPASVLSLASARGVGPGLMPPLPRLTGSADAGGFRMLQQEGVFREVFGVELVLDVVVGL